MDINIKLIDSEFYCDDLETVCVIEAERQDREHKKKEKRRYIKRDFARFDKILDEDYFCESPRYPSDVFNRRFRMCKTMFLRIAEDMAAYDPYFRLRYNAAKQRGLSTIQKCTAAVRMLAYGNSADSVDEYVKVAETTLLEILRKFCDNVILLYGARFLRSPDENDVAKLMNENSKRGFPGMLGSIDCMHWTWKNCPVAHAGQYQGKEGKPTMVLEAVASQNLHIWHCFFGLPGSLNDINVLDRSPLVDTVVQERIPKASYTIRGTTRTTGYWLADGIYPDWPIFVKTINDPSNKKKAAFAKRQESVRKDVERAFGVLQSQWSIIKSPARLWDDESLKQIMKTCVILHNMNIESNEIEMVDPENLQDTSVSRSMKDPPDGTIAWLLKARQNMKNKVDHVSLQNDLIDHVWELEGGGI